MTQREEHDDLRNKGQTLAEFAITLPLLLLLLFGIIEFGRMFQSWVTIQNSVRVAARYTVTGQYDTTRYSLDSIPCETNSLPLPQNETQIPLYTPPGFNLVAFQTKVTPAVYTQRYTYVANVLYVRVPVFTNPGTPLNESLYRSWYGDDDCFPDNESVQARKDILRLPSIYDVARIGAAGLSLEPSATNVRAGETPELTLRRFLNLAHQNPSPSVDTPAYFSVQICSARGGRYTAEGSSTIVNNPDGTERRYFTNQDANDYAAGACIIQENVAATAPTLLNQYALPTWDAGGAGDRVTLIVTYNHPLITPLGLARYVRMQANRAAVNESFKVTRADVPPPPGGSGGPAPSTPITPSPTTPPTLTPLPTATTPAPPPTLTPLPTDIPFSCSLITATPIAFVENRMRVEFKNANRTPVEGVYLTATKMNWESAQVRQVFPNIAVNYFTFDGQIVWQGNDQTSPTDTRVAAIAPASPNANGVTNINSSQRFWVYESPAPDGTVFDPNVFEAWFINGPDTLNGPNAFQGWEFSGTEFYFDNPTIPGDDQLCVISLQTPQVPIPTLVPPNFIPSPTFTPDCAGNLLKVDFESFQANGDVQLRITNNRTVVSPFRGFEIVWPAWRISDLTLSSVIASTRADLNASAFTGGSGGTRVWNSLTGGGFRPAGVVVGNPNPATRTRHDNTAAGTWNDNNDPYDIAYSFNPGVSYLYLNFSGVGVDSLESRFVGRSDFNGTRFFLECGRPTGVGGNGWGGGGPTGGEIILSNNPTPMPTLPPLPTRTPGPTPTSSNTPPPPPPTPISTIGPPPPVNTPLPTQGPTNTPPPTGSPTPNVLG